MRLAVLQRCPFTLVMLTALIGLGIYGQTHLGPLDAALHRQVGHSARLLLEGHLHRMVTSIFFTAGGWQFYCSLVMFAASVGWAEFVSGTRRTVLVFFGIHLATLSVIVIGFAIPLAFLATYRGQLLFEASDVGPSAGYYGCLGLAVGGLAAGKRAGIAAIMIVLLVRAMWSAMHLPEEGRVMSADLAHLVAFPLGLLAQRMYGRWDRQDDLNDESVR